VSPPTPCAARPQHLCLAAAPRLRIARHLGLGLVVPNASSTTLFFSHAMAEDFPSGNQSSIFRARSFNRICNFRVLAIKLLLELRYDVLASDVDVVFMYDPWPLFRGPHTCNYEYQQNMAKAQEGPLNEGNGGYTLWWHSTVSAEFLVKMLIQAESTPGRDDQAALWTTIRALENKLYIGTKEPNSPRHGGTTSPRHANDGTLRYCPLPYTSFPAGKQLTKPFLRNAAVMHANWLDGKYAKRQVITRLGLWALDCVEEGTCTVNGSRLAPLDKFHAQLASGSR